MMSAEVGLNLRLAQPGDAETIWRLIRTAFLARRALEPPADALGDSVAGIRQRLGNQLGVLATLDGEPVGCLFVCFNHDRQPPAAMLHRVSVLPGVRGRGIAHAMVRGAVDLALDAGMRRMQLIARRELPELISWWVGHGFEPVGGRDEHRVLLACDLPVRFPVAAAADMRRLGERLARLLLPGDLIVVSGELGAGKTTLAQGLGRGLRVAGPVISPTFVLSRIHPPLGAGPALVHVDAYRLGSAAELDDLDLDASLADSVTLVEWGTGLVEQLTSERLEIDIERGGTTRIVTIRGLGARWRGVDLCALEGREVQ